MTYIHPADFKIGLNFTGSSREQLTPEEGNPQNINLSIPPDTMGAVGEDQIVELINGSFAVYDKETGNELERSSLDQFWIDAGVTPVGDGGSFDPRVLYDSHTDRWFAVAVDNGRAANNFLVAVSTTDDPTDPWKAFAIDSDADDSHWAARMFNLNTSDQDSTTFLGLDKSDLIDGIETSTLVENISLNETGSRPQPIVDLDNALAPHPFLSAITAETQTVLLRRSDENGTFIEDIDVTNQNLPPLFARQPGGPNNVDTGGNPLRSNIILVNGSIWGVQAVENGGRSALRWFEIDEATNNTIQEGLITDPDLDLSYASIAVNPFEDVVIGFSGSGDNQFISSYAALGNTDGAGNTTFSGANLAPAETV